MQDFKYNIIDNILNRKMQRVDQIVQSIDSSSSDETHTIEKLLEVSKELEHVSSTLMPYFKNISIEAGRAD